MKKIEKLYYPFFTTVLILLVLIIATAYLSHQKTSLSKNANKIQKTINKERAYNSQVALSLLDSIQYIESKEQVLFHEYHDTTAFSNVNWLAYKNDTLAYWSSNSITFFKDQLPKLGYNHLPNGIYWIDSYTKDNSKLFSFIKIKETYRYKNKYLQPDFTKEFPLDNIITLSKNKKIGYHPILFDNQHKASFYIGISTTPYYIMHEDLLYLSFVAILILIILYASFLIKILLSYKYKWHFAPFIIYLLATYPIYLLLFTINKSPYLSQLDIFSPYEFAINSYLSSVGELFVLVVLIIFSSIIFNKICITHYKDKGHKLGTVFSAFIMILPIISWIIYIKGFKLIVTNSLLNFDFSSKLDFSICNILGVSSVSILFFIFITNTLTSWRLMNKSISKFIYIIISTILFIIVHLILDGVLHYKALICFIITLIILSFVKNNYHKIRYYVFISICLIGSILTNELHTFFHVEREKKQAEVAAQNIASNRDPIAEILLGELENKILSDPEVGYYLKNLSSSQLQEYITQEYLGGYWRKYDALVTFCSPLDSLNIKPDNYLIPCYDFFREMMLQDGSIIPLTSFYFMERVDGKISYLGQLNITPPNSNIEYSLFIELIIKDLPEGIGYPELLLDEKINRQVIPDNFSYAKYYNNQLVNRHGEVSYPLRFTEHQEDVPNKSYVHRSGNIHYILKKNEKNFIIVSIKELTSLNQLINLPYLFIILFVTGLFIFISPPSYKRLGAFKGKLKYKILYSIVITLMVFITILGVGIIWYNIIAFQEKIESDLIEKIQSVTFSLELEFGDSNTLEPNMKDDLETKLIELSDVFWLDINIYNTHGDLYSTSRYEVFDKGLTGLKMNRNAYDKLAHHDTDVYIHQEALGNLNFYSTYYPFFNNKGEIMGYVNIPYFSRQDTLKKEVSAFVVTFLNLYILLSFISLIAAVLISSRITHPLSLLESKLKTVRLDKVNEHIQINTKDEIGKLVEEYNKKVDELEQSAKLLAKSERESAWREMARQIAHEIKNPLTPMKLNIQYLQRAQKQRKDNFEEFFNKVTKSLIDQIDSLASIATSFSNFAKMPKANNEEVNILTILNKIKNLLSSTGNINIHFDESDIQPIVWIDPQQFSRGLINIITNGQQSTMNKYPSQIDIYITDIENQYWEISIQDNGLGIKDDEKEKIFTPYFTTKSSGTGLGLAITKNIIKNADGEISFTSTEGKGTTFIIQLPKR